MSASTNREEHTMPRVESERAAKRAREYQHIKASVKRRGASEKKAEEIAARTVNKDRATRGRVPDPVQGLAARQVAIRARRPTFGNEPTEGSHA